MAKPITNAQMEQFVESGGRKWELGLGDQWRVQDGSGMMTGRVNVHPYMHGGQSLDNVFWVGFGCRRPGGEQEHFIVGTMPGSRETCLAEGLSHLKQAFPDMLYTDRVVLEEKESRTN